MKTSDPQSEVGGSPPTSALQISAASLEISPCGVSEIRSFVEKNHYSRSINGVKISCCFKVEVNGRLIGGVIFGALSTTAWKRFSDSEQKVLELRRLVLVDEAGKNSESRVVGWCLRWVKKNFLGVDVVVSYADPLHGHSGAIYRAANFKYAGVGSRDVGFKDRETGKVYHSRALRTKNTGGEFKPFVKRLRAKHAAGQLEKIFLPGKHCFTYTLR